MEYYTAVKMNDMDLYVPIQEGLDDTMVIQK